MLASAFKRCKTGKGLLVMQWALRGKLNFCRRVHETAADRKQEKVGNSDSLNIADKSLSKIVKVTGNSISDKPSIVILGTGWGAISFLKDIDARRYNVTVISPRNYFLFTPLLPSTPVGTVDEKSIIEPVMNFALKKKSNVSYYEAEATSINPDRNSVTINSVSTVSQLGTSEDHLGLIQNGTAEIKYDYLVSAVGVKPNTFGIRGVEEHGNFLKEISDSFRIRKHFVCNIEKASFLPHGDPERKRLLTVVVVGGGPTGVETAGEFQDYVNQDLKRFMPSIAEEVQIHLVEALPNILNMFERKLTSYAQSVLENANINLMLNTAVEKVEEKYLVSKTKNEDGTIIKKDIPYGTLIWATGNNTRLVISDLIGKIPAQAGSTRGLAVDGYMMVKGTNNIFAIGDNALAGLAPTAQVAHQQAEFLAKLFDKMAKIPGFHSQLSQKKVKVDLFFEENGFKPFKYVHLGSLAYLGAEKAIANITYGKRSLYTGGGLITFYIWRITYFIMLLSNRSRFKVIADWLKLTCFKRDCFKGL